MLGCSSGGAANGSGTAQVFRDRRKLGGRSFGGKGLRYSVIELVERTVTVVEASQSLENICTNNNPPLMSGRCHLPRNYTSRIDNKSRIIQITPTRLQLHKLSVQSNSAFTLTV